MSKRTPLPSLPTEQDPRLRSVSRCWPIFWVRCTGCQLDFRRERGWKYWWWLGEDDVMISVVKHLAYRCLECAPTQEDVAKLSGNQFIHHRPA